MYNIQQAAFKFYKDAADDIFIILMYLIYLENISLSHRFSFFYGNNL